MKIACISDTHGVILPDIPEGVDFVIHAGDIGPDRKPLQWFIGPFKHWLQGLEARNIGFFGTWGNHDFIGREQDFSKILPGNTQLVVDKAVTVMDALSDEEADDDTPTVKLWLSPWSPTFGNWAWMEPDHLLRARYFDIEDDVDIIVSHGPPRGYGDLTTWQGVTQNVGSQSLLEEFKAHRKAKYLICGHIHQARGCYEIDGTDKKVINCSQVDEMYAPHGEAIHIIEV